MQILLFDCGFLALSIYSCLFAVVCPSAESVRVCVLKHCIFKLSVILTLLFLPNFMLSRSSCYNQLKYVCQLLSHLPPEFFFSVWHSALSKYSFYSAAYKYCRVQSTSLSLPPSRGGFCRKLSY